MHISRRKFFTGSLAAGAALAPLPFAAAAPNPTRRLRIAHLTDLHIQPELDAVRGVAACLVCWATDWLRRAELPRIHMPAPVAPPLRLELIAAGRITVGAGLAAAIAYAAGWHHPSWAAIGATAVMQGAHLHITMNRALQRMVGTVVGALLVGLILSANPSFWWIAACIVAFQFITEVIIGYNYALGQITVTPMALLMTYLASPALGASMPVERIMDTILGAALGIVFTVVFSSLDDRAYLHKLHQK